MSPKDSLHATCVLEPAPCDLVHPPANRPTTISPLDFVIHGVYFFIYGFLKYLPSPVGDWLRYLATKPFIKSMGTVRLYEGVTLWYPYRISLGDNVTLNEWVYISGFGSCSIGNGVRIGHRTSIISADHIFADPETPIYKQSLVAAPVVIEDDCWIGCNVTILKGVRIGRGAVVAAGAVVVKDVAPLTIVGGVPARPIGVRGNSV